MNILKGFRSKVLVALAVTMTLAAPASAKLSLPNEESAVPATRSASGPGEVRYAQVVGAWGDGSSRRIHHGGGHHQHQHHGGNRHHGGYRYHGGYRHHGGWYGGYGPGWGWGGWGGPNIGVVVEVPIYPRYRPIYRRDYVGGSAHLGWCAQRYRSYRAWDNTFQPFHGPRRYCISPYR